jgi:hypothetical protein
LCSKEEERKRILSNVHMILQRKNEKENIKKTEDRTYRGKTDVD